MSPDEKRGAERFLCDGGVEVRSPGATSGFWGTLTDISATGCYVSSFSPLPSGTEVETRVQVKHNGMEFQAKGRVTTFHPGVGMGVCFTSLEPSQRESLNRLIAELQAQKQ
jgi:PilZ domain-containing protein